MSVLLVLLQIPDPAPAAPPGTEGVTTVLNWASWIVAVLCGLGVLIVAGTMAVQHRRGEGFQAAGKLGWVLGACVLLGAGVPALNTIVAG